MTEASALETLEELTVGMVKEKDQRSIFANRKFLPEAILRKASFVDAGSGVFMSNGDEKLGIKQGSFWTVKESEGKRYLARVDGDEEEKVEEASVEVEADLVPKEFPTSTELYDFFIDSGGRVESEGKDFCAYLDSKEYTYKDMGGSLRLSSDLEKEAAGNSSPLLREVPEQVELDVKNKYQEIEKERDLSTSERSDLELMEEDLERKGLSFEP